VIPVLPASILGLYTNYIDKDHLPCYFNLRKDETTQSVLN